MRYRPLGPGGPAISEISLGSYRTYGNGLDLERSRACIRRALEVGINFFDTADVYGDGESERTLGRLLREHGGGEWLVASKVFFPWPGQPSRKGLSAEHIVETVERSLGNLGVERIDLMQCHRHDPETPIEETVRAMDALVREGKVRMWGVGRLEAAQIDAVVACADAHGLSRPVAHQTAYSPLYRAIEEKVLDAGARHDVGVWPTAFWAREC